MNGINKSELLNSWYGNNQGTVNAVQNLIKIRNPEQLSVNTIIK